MSVVRLYGDKAVSDARRAIKTGWWHDIPVVPAETYRDYPCEIRVNNQLMPIVPMRGSKAGFRQASSKQRVNEWQIHVATRMGYAWGRCHKKHPVFFMKTAKQRFGDFGLGSSIGLDDYFRSGFYQACYDRNIVIEGRAEISINHVFVDGCWVGVTCYRTKDAGKGLRKLSDMMHETLVWGHRFAA